MSATTAVHAHDDHDDHDHDEAGLTTIMKLKIAMIVILFCIVYLGLIPAYSKFFRSSKVILSLLNCFAGGVFLAMAFIHILPESAEQYNDVMKELAEEENASNTTATAKAGAHADHEEEHGAHVFPLPYLLFFIGYMMVLLIDRVFAGEHGHSHGNNSEHSHDHKHTDKELVDSERKLAESPNNQKEVGFTPKNPPMEVQDIENDFD